MIIIIKIAYYAYPVRNQNATKNSFDAIKFMI